MNTPKFTETIAPQTLECCRCLDQGRVALIFAGDKCVEFDRDGKIEFVCAECWDRLWDRVIGGAQ